MSSDRVPLWFGDADSPLFGWIHLPRAASSGGAVVLCPPLYREGLPTESTYLSMAQSLAGEGLHVVRFDYAGTGDSSGPPSGPESVEAMCRDIDQAIALVQTYIAGPLALGGFRMGGLLAAKAAERRRDVDVLLVWDPPASGRAFVRRQQALGSINLGGRAASGGMEVPGYVISADLVADLKGLVLPPSLPVSKALLYLKPEIEVPELSLSSSVGSGSKGVVEVRRLAPGESEQFFDVDPLLRTEPTGAVEEAVSWLVTSLNELASPEGGAQPSESTRLVSEATEAAELHGRIDEAKVSERVVSLGPLGLFGIETSLAEGAERASTTTTERPVVVFLSSGADNHTGPNRMWVTLARDWARLGYRCVRVDLSGLGESPARPGQAAQVIRPIEAFDDVLDVAEAVHKDRHNVVLVGLCSGAYQAFESAFELRPVGVLGINPLLRFQPPEMAVQGKPDPRRTVCIPRPSMVDTWRDAIPGPVARLGIALRRRRTGRRDRDRLVRWERDLAELGVKAYFVCGDEEAKELRGVLHASEPTWSATGGLRIDVVTGLDHALLVEADRSLIEARLTEVLQEIGEPDAGFAPLLATEGGALP